jgi:sugar phosphate isomerase/epimerase
MGVCVYSFGYRRPKSAYEFLDYCHELGAGGVQIGLDSLEPESTQKVRRRAEQLEMYLEVIADLPADDPSGFERTVRAAKEAGALCLRAACLSGRRYETFSTLEEWKRFVTESRNKIARALPILEKYRMPLGLENHKDSTAEEMVGLLKEYSSEYLGACIDTGNNIALLDDPMDVVERLAPYAVTTHLKDMAAEEYAEGFLLAEVPLGQGILDMKGICQTIARARPQAKFSLEMITRNPLKIPCLSERYWATFPDRSGECLARTLSLVRAHRPSQPLPRPDALDPAVRLRLEEDNVRKCLAYASAQLRLVRGPLSVVRCP